jgi:amino acid adenylation domain-containing protein
VGSRLSTHLDFNLEQAVIDRFDDVVAACAGRIAVAAPDRHLSYQDLAAESYRISAGLARIALASRRIALFCPHEAASVAAILGVLRSGKSWVPLDPRDPAARLTERWHDAGEPPLVCARAHQAKAREVAGASVLVLDQLGGASAPTDKASPHDEAYLLYTSGSTGRPKGVLQSQRNLLYHARAYASSLALRPEDRIALVASLAVDAALMDMFGALLVGASLHLWDARRLGAEGLSDWLGRNAITIYHSTPTLFRFWAREQTRCLPDLRRVVLGGEAASREDFDLFRRVCGEGAVLVNGLGPTESTTALQAFFTHRSRVGAGLLPVGRPVAGTEVVLYADDQAQADLGELAIRSPYIALGYWQRPELDRAVFLPDPDGGDRRIYRTGDRLQRLDDGSFLFLGRCDQRLKLHGWTIEPAEIEARLRASPGIAEAAVVLTEGPGEPCLTAFVCCRPGEAPSEAALTARLRAELPQPAVPARIVAVESFPLTTSGKLDRRTLAAMPSLRQGGRSPRGAVETWVAAAYSDLLAVAEVGADDDFFALGGHSLLALRLLSRIRECFGVQLTLASLFEATTPAALAARIATPTGRPLIPGVQPRARDERPLLSFGQERLLFLDRLAPGDPTYHVPALARLRGEIDPEALDLALREVVGRHEALRSRFALEGGEPRLRLVDDTALPFDIVALPEATGSEPLAAALSVARNRAREPFDLGQGPLLRVALIRLGADDTLLLLTAHHIAVDGWSMRQLFAEWSAAYARRCRGETAEPSPPHLQYSDYSTWQRRTLDGPLALRLCSYWQARLAGVPALQLPSDRPRPPLPSRRGGCCSFEIPAALAGQLRRLAQETATTLYTVLLASYGVLLGRHAQQDDFVIASPVAGRGHPDFDDVVGTFINTLPLRLDLSGSPTVREVLARTRRTFLDALANADLPFEQVVAALGSDRDPSSTPLAQAMLIVHQGPPAQLRAAGVAVEPIELHLGVAMFDLTLTVRDMRGEPDDPPDDRLLAWFEYACDLFDQRTIERLRDRWLCVLGAFADDRDRPVAELEILPPSERAYLARELNATQRAYHLDVSVGARIFATAARHPDAVAVLFQHEQLRYRELLQWSRRIASQVVDRGVAPGALVPVIADRGLELVPALLGVLAANAAFVPMDADWPQARLQAALHRIRPVVVLVDQANAELPVLAEYPHLVLQRHPASGDSDEGTLLAAPPPSPEAPVYGFFTSGSTGEPKLALVAHRGLANRFAWMDEAFGDDPPVTLQTTPHVFDSAVWQLLWPLCRGGRAVVPGTPSLLTGREIVDLVERHGVTIVDFVPSVLDALLPQLASDARLERRLCSLRDVVVGGEALLPATLRALRRSLQGVRVTNLYGPTEATIGCIAAVLAGDEAEVPIGRPIANVQAVVLDQRQCLVPLGVPGELCLGGACLGLGYFGDEVATRRSFIRNPIAELGGDVLYRTGDRVCQRGDGAFRFLGRCDDQIKLRGLRIEPAEVEAALRGHPAVREAFVSVGSSPCGEPELWAWTAPAPLPPDLLGFLRARLPSAMIPTRLMACEALPRLPGGKVDRRALPPPLAVSPGRAALGHAWGATERIVAEIWQGLAVDATLPTRSFFEAGGTSLLALRVHFELERRLGRTLALVDLFRYPTIAALAAHLDGRAEGTASISVPNLDRRARTIERRRRRKRG